MIKEAIELLHQQSVDGSGLDLIQKVPGVKSVYWSRANRNTVCVDAIREPVHVEAFDLDSLSGLLSLYSLEGPSCWIGGDRITILFATAEPLDRAVMMYASSSQHLAMLKLGKATPQDVMIDTLRTELHGCYPEHGDFLTIIRTLKWSQEYHTSGDIQQASHSLGNKVERRVVGADTIPDEIVFRLPLTDVPELENDLEEVPCNVVVNIEAKTIALKPKADIYQRAVRATQQRLIDEMQQALTRHGHSMPVLRGCP